MQSTLNKKEYWEDHIKKWEASSLSQKAYCEGAQIKLTTFVFWKSHLNKSNNKKFIPLKIKTLANDTSIKIKMLTGNIVSIPWSIGIDEIAKLICLLEKNDA